MLLLLLKVTEFLSPEVHTKDGQSPWAAVNITACCCAVLIMEAEIYEARNQVFLQYYLQNLRHII